MITAICHLESVSPLSSNRGIRSAKPSNIREDEFEKRTWKERINEENGIAIIPAMAMKKALMSASSYLGMKVPGKGMATYSKYFTCAILVTENINLGVKVDTIQGEWIHVPSDGVSLGSGKGGQKRVWKMFPLIPSWKTTARVEILDNIITKEVFKEHIEQAGAFIGLGRFRPERGGFYGRFKVTKIEWK